MEEKDSVMSLIRKINYKVKAQIDSSFKEHDMTFSQSQLMHYLEFNGKSATQKQLQEYLKVSHPTIVGLVKRLENHNFVRTEVDQNDKRNKIVIATNEAEKFKQDLIEKRNRMTEIMYQNLSEEELEELTRLLSIIYKNLEQGGTKEQ